MKNTTKYLTAYDVSVKLNVSIVGLYKKLITNNVPKKFANGSCHWFFTEKEVDKIIKPLYKRINTGGNPNRLYKPKRGVSHGA